MIENAGVPFYDSDASSTEFGLVNYGWEFYSESLYKSSFEQSPVVPTICEEVDSLSDIEEKPLNNMESAVVISLLEDAVDQLIIIKYLIGTPVVYVDSHYRTPKDRFTRRLTPERIYPEADSKPALTPAIKLQKDRESIELIFIKTEKAILEDNFYFPIKNALENGRREDEDDKLLVQELKENLMYMKNLKQKVEEKRRLEDQEEKEREALLHFLQDELDDVTLKCKVEEKFVSKWENIRQSQNKYKLKMAENFYTENIDLLSTKSATEKRVTYELQLLLKSDQLELEEQLEEWMELYDSEMERRETNILQLKYNTDQEILKKEQLREAVKNRRREMEEWCAFRDRRNIQMKAALQIQSWWRGTMLRKKLGPYKQKKNKVGKSKENKVGKSKENKKKGKK